MRGLDKFFPQCTRTSVRAFLAQRLCDRDGFDSLTLRHGQTSSRECKTGLPQRFWNKIKQLFGSWKTAKARRSAFPSQTRSYKGILLATLLRRLRWSSASTASSLSGRRLLNVPLRVPGHDNAQRSTCRRVAHMDVVIVVVLCSREAVCFACQACLDSQLKHLPAAPRAPPQSANRQPRGHVVPHTA